jgi:membrane-bound hydrogenase subunit mbhJ
MSVFEKLLARSRAKSPWVYLANSGSCNGCDIEVVASLTPRYDAEQLGVLRQGSPKHADILVVTGPLTLRTKDAVLDVYHQMPQPKAVVAVGSCPATGNVFAGSPTVMNGVCDVLPVDVFVPGCPPRPQAIIEGIALAADLLAEKRAKRIPLRTSPAGEQGEPAGDRDEVEEAARG